MHLNPLFIAKFKTNSGYYIKISGILGYLPIELGQNSGGMGALPPLKG